MPARRRLTAVLPAMPKKATSWVLAIVVVTDGAVMVAEAVLARPLWASIGMAGVDPAVGRDGADRGLRLGEGPRVAGRLTDAGDMHEHRLAQRRAARISRTAVQPSGGVMVGTPRTVTAATSTSLVVVPIGLASTRLVVPVLVPAALARSAMEARRRRRDSDRGCR